MTILQRWEPNNSLRESESFRSKTKIKGNTPVDGNAKDVEVMVALKDLCNFLKTIAMPLINREINLTLTWSPTCVITNSTVAWRFVVTKLYVSAVTLSTQGNAKLSQQLKCGFKRSINWNKYQSNKSKESQKQHLDFLINPSFQQVNRLFVLSFENENGMLSHSGCYLLKVEIKDFNVKIDERNVFD